MAAQTPPSTFDRRDFLKGAGALVVGFQIAGSNSAYAQFGIAPIAGSPPGEIGRAHV